MNAWTFLAFAFVAIPIAMAGFVYWDYRRHKWPTNRRKNRTSRR